jgi:putative membrane protein
VKPLVFWLTLPITGLTFGLFYIFINVATLKLVQYITINHFIITGYIMPFIVACFISIMNILIDELVINKFKKRG